LGLAQRVTYDPERNILFLNLEGMHVKTRDDVDRVRRVAAHIFETNDEAHAFVAAHEEPNP